MTLILALASRHRVLLVSDRQLTDIDPVTKEHTPHPNPATKSVMFENRAIFGYTGYSILEGLSADLWIAETISQVHDGNIMRALALICDGLNRSFRPFRPSDDICYHAVLASGFRPLADGSWQAFNASIANARIGQRPSRTFTVEVYDVPPGRMALTQEPILIKDEAFTTLNRDLGRGGERGVTFTGGTEMLVGAIRTVAKKHAEVGVDLIAASIPVPSSVRLGESYIGLGEPDNAGGSFEYLSPGQVKTHFLPTLVMNGMITHGAIEEHS